jgi:hypothetical protein
MVAGRATALACAAPVPSPSVAYSGRKAPEAEAVEDLTRRLDEAARYISLDQVAIRPQCGFSSALGGYPLTQASSSANSRF